MDIQRIVLLALVAALVLGLLFKRSQRAPDFMKALRAFRCDPEWREITFHKKLKAHLESRLPLDRVMTEAGVSGSTTRVDLHAEYGTIDYLMTVKKGLSAQKVKTLVGEVREILRSWPQSEKRTVLLVVLYGEAPEGGDDHLMTLGKHLRDAMAQRKDVHVDLIYVHPLGDN